MQQDPGFAAEMAQARRQENWRRRWMFDASAAQLGRWLARTLKGARRRQA